MKRCPFCAEEIQDQAIKCKHCGEWLNKQEESEVVEEVILHQGEEESTQPNDSKVYIIPTKKRGWGWGWFVVLSLYAWSFKNFYPVSFEAMFIQGVGCIIILILYFKLRKYFGGKDPLQDIPKSASLKAGIASYAATMIFIALAAYFNIAKIDNDLMSMLDSISISKLEISITNLNESFNFDEPEKIKKSLAALETARAELDKTQNAVNKIIKYFNDNRIAIDKTKLAPILKTEELFHILEHHFNLLREYLVEGKKVLNYALDNYSKLKGGSKKEDKIFLNLLENWERIENQVEEYQEIRSQKVREFYNKYPDLIGFLNEKWKEKLSL